MTPKSEPSWVERAFTCEMLGRPPNSLESDGTWASLESQATCAEPFLPFDMEKWQVFQALLFLQMTNA